MAKSKPKGKAKKGGRRAKTVTEPQKRFAREFIIVNDVSKAARNIKMNRAHADELVNSSTYAHVQAYIQKLRDERNERLERDADWVMKELEECYVAAKTAFLRQCKPVEKVDVNGEIYEECSPDARLMQASVKHLELMGKQMGMFAQKVEHKGKLSLVDLVSSVDEEVDWDD